MRVEKNDNDFCVEASLVGELFGVSPSDVQTLMRTDAVTSHCERGIAEHEGEYRLTFFYRNRRARLSVDQTGRILRRSIVDFGEHPLPPAMHKPGG